MKLRLLTHRATLLLALATATPALAQVPLNPTTPAAADTTHKYENPTGVPTVVKKPFFKSKVFKAAIVPAVLIGYGAYTFNGGGFYTNQDAQRDIHRLFPSSKSRIADYLIFAPYLELGAVTLAGVESRNDRLNVLLIIAKSEAIMLSSTFVVKALSHEERPDGSDNLSFPSGHTAQAFLAASIVHTEFRDKSQWYGIGAYAIATSVAGLRMIVDKHWQSDVVAGAGFGILSAHLAYLTHRNRWGRKAIGRDIGFAPTFYGSTPGLTITWRPKK
ncbi:phosphatase PAP2 family protein [Hymenobacter sp. HMF4947]|uniref:Phosphatase PAP2 family protein n=1 Tax=Hymenobacter ginkgonis TaxID=2682976 RepID=A0A7K1T9S0_9BACT|nr:phosphatase PAP2 family protein [Hymenobacter ginkgonis]MVN75157.1 phosphatase PAP2 family protein [Hymenobacter ginkgonis]